MASLCEPIKQKISIGILEWRSASGGNVPFEAIHAGVDTGHNIYVARAHLDGGVIPGKLHQTHTSVYIPYASKEVLVDKYEVLCGPPAILSWVDCFGGIIPSSAFIGGKDPSGETLFIGRVIHNGTLTVGKVHPSHGCCYVPYGGKELSFTEYEILVNNKLEQIPKYR